MTKIKIFESDKEINLPILIDSRMLVMANSGAGKSYLVRKILEESHGKVMSIILDFEGESKEEKNKPMVIILDNNPISLSCYAQEYPENWKKICEALEKRNEQA